MLTIDAFLAALELEPAGPHRYRAANLPVGHGTVFGGQLLAQSITAAAAGHEGLAVKTVHTVFARGARPDAPLDITVDPMHAGRTFASDTVTIAQGDRLCARSIVLLHAPEDDLIRHADRPVSPSTPADAKPGEDWGVWEIRLSATST